MILRPNFIPIYRYQPETPAYTAVLASGQLSVRSRQHLDKFIRDCKEAGVWSLLTFCMPFISDGFTNAFLADIIGGVTVTAVNFVAGDASEANGLTGDGSTKYLNLGIAASAALGAAGHIAFYQRTDNVAATTKMSIGAASGTEEFWIGSGNPSTTAAGRYGKTTSASDANPMVKGFYYLERQSATDLKLYHDNTQLVSVATNVTAVPPGLNIFAWAYNAVGTPTGQNGVTGSFLSIGAAMTAQQRADYYAIVQTLQTNLGRAV